MESVKSFGEGRVRVSFNTEKNSVVDEIKHKAAELINLIASIEDGASRVTPLEVTRLKALAMTAIEEGAMWAVKAETSVRF